MLQPQYLKTFSIVINASMILFSDQFSCGIVVAAAQSMFHVSGYERIESVTYDQDTIIMVKTVIWLFCVCIFFFVAISNVNMNVAY